MEEIYELLDAEAEMKYSNLASFDNIDRMKQHIIEELADSYVVLEQHRLYWNITLKDIEEVFKYKVDRTYKGWEK